ncbi:DegT/DnrJ/EryC1/StrS family aminotransferase [Denitrobaculum tricleocarpae]|uniref:Aminotransferase class I/II-fold pyridoxal phosphate-dependent enzyme n=1 Tax=Denitrobaculum tricleocarpae TaxID=2591009 RepID=A0A545U0S0_9PROT|nr:DegT/DnrJ/EryC1/StrS family aminotransferase [Denitrobaculum tricleocarpae]TQV83062.1 aminotransferase class I/II-fold pyridoxal phosphate-dependent enzyme [Denitrobaculum tricleocarpae]
MAEVTFSGDLSAPDPVPEAGIEAAVRLLRDGRLFRYGEDRSSIPEAALLEQEFAAYQGRKYCVAVNSGGCAIFLALKAAGVCAGDKVLVNAFTLAPVPGAISHAGADPVLVDINDRYVVDLEDLDRKAAESGAGFFLMSFMRGHIPDMDAVVEICARHGITMIEDCAHTMGGGWNGRLTGTFGKAGCFSAQTFKQINSGEGGLIVTDDEDLAARAILLSGSYMLYAQHRARPPMEVFERHRFSTPNCSMRMSGLVAALLRPQLASLDERNLRWRRIYDTLAAELAGIDGLVLPARPAEEDFAPTSMQFSVSPDLLDDGQLAHFIQDADAHGVHVKWFGATDPVGFTSRHDHWRYIDGSAAGAVPNADRILSRLCDFRLPLWLSEADCRTIAAVLKQAVAAARSVGNGSEKIRHTA